MRKGLSTAIAILIFLGLATPAYAQVEFKPRPERLNKIASRAAEMRAKQQTKLQEFRDQKKAKLVAQVSDSLNKINQRHTEQMTKHLARMTEILAKVEPSPQTETAQQAIQTAQAAVDAQEAKDYTIVVSSEADVRADAKRARGQLQTDLKSVNALLKEAKQALITAIQEANHE